MKKTGIFYGSTTGTTESVARLIAEKLGVSSEDVHDVSKLDAALAESSESYSDTFCDGMGILFEDLKNSGCTFVGAVPDSDYTYASSVAAADGKFVGLALDDVNESDQTDARVSAWTEMLKADLA